MNVLCGSLHAEEVVHLSQTLVALGQVVDLVRRDGVYESSAGRSVALGRLDLLQHLRGDAAVGLLCHGSTRHDEERRQHNSFFVHNEDRLMIMFLIVSKDKANA